MRLLDVENSVFVHCKRLHHALGIELTLACPVACGHCARRAGPHRDERLDPSAILEALQLELPRGQLALLVLSGGEPFVEARTLRRILALAARHHVAAAVNTSAFWATDPEAARRTIDQYPGLTHLDVSADVYHARKVPLRYVRWALEAAIEAGVEPTLMVRVWDERDDPFLGQLATAIGDDLLDLVAVDLQEIDGGLGRAVDLRRSRGTECCEELPPGPCDSAYHLIVDHDGTVAACCSLDNARRIEALRAGRIGRQTLRSMMERVDDDPVLQAIRVRGPAYLARLLYADGGGHLLRGRYPKGQRCALCADLLGGAETVSRLRGLLAEPLNAAELTMARWLRLGEVQQQRPASWARGDER